MRENSRHLRFAEQKQITHQSRHIGDLDYASLEIDRS